MKKRKFHGGRAMLNQPGHHSTAAIVAEVEDTSTWQRGRNGRGQPIKAKWDAHAVAIVAISDCSRIINLEFDPSDPEEHANDIAKIDVMLGLLTEFRAGLLIEQQRYLDRVEGLAK